MRTRFNHRFLNQPIDKSESYNYVIGTTFVGLGMLIMYTKIAFKIYACIPIEFQVFV